MGNAWAQIPRLYHLPGFHEPFSAISHLLGALLFLWLGALLLRRGRGDPVRLAFLGVYAGSCVLLLSLSGVYHMMVRGGTAHGVFERLDHGAIFVLIAGTFTPLHGILFRGRLRWGPLVFVWALAVTAITLKTVFFSGLHEWVGLSLYLGLGWLGVFSGSLLWRRHGFAFVRPLLLGGVVYSIGAVSEYHNFPVLIPGVVHGHEVFHLAVLAGAFLHWRFIWQFAAGEDRIP
jgi:hemolysin III